MESGFEGGRSLVSACLLLLATAHVCVISGCDYMFMVRWLLSH